jgi:hypothetical protein
MVVVTVVTVVMATLCTDSFVKRFSVVSPKHFFPDTKGGLIDLAGCPAVLLVMLSSKSRKPSKFKLTDSLVQKLSKR